MLYTRSSFIKWLTDVKGCKIQPLGGNTLKVTNGIASGFIWASKKM
jgi:hypothetical protein